MLKIFVSFRFKKNTRKTLLDFDDFPQISHHILCWFFQSMKRRTTPNYFPKFQKCAPNSLSISLRYNHKSQIKSFSSFLQSFEVVFIVQNFWNCIAEIGEKAEVLNGVDIFVFAIMIFDLCAEKRVSIARHSLCAVKFHCDRSSMCRVSQFLFYFFLSLSILSRTISFMFHQKGQHEVNWHMLWISYWDIITRVHVVCTYSVCTHSFAYFYRYSRFDDTYIYIFCNNSHKLTYTPYSGYDSIKSDAIEYCTKCQVPKSPKAQYLYVLSVKLSETLRIFVFCIYIYIYWNIMCTRISTVSNSNVSHNQ